jgi:hypothetical protein
VTITMLVSRYKITVQEEPRFAGEAWVEKKERVLKATRGTTVKYVRTHVGSAMWANLIYGEIL